MSQVSVQLARKVVVNLGRAQNAIDASLKKMTDLTAGVLDAFDEAKLSDVATQPALEYLAKGFSTIVAGRAAFVDAHRELIEMKMDSELRHVEIGCSPGPACPVSAQPSFQLVA